MFDVSKIFSFFKKNFNRKDFLLGLGLVALFFLSRIIFLDKLPIFSDEGIYIHWARIAWHDASWRFISLTDGRQPLQTWGTIPFLKLFPQNLLFGGRMFSVATGFISLTGVFSLLFYLFNKKTAFWGAFLYIFTPFFLFYDRIALADSAVNSGFIWILFFSILVVKTLRLDLAILFGITAGMAMLTKSSVRLFIGLAVFAPILIWNKKFGKNIINKAVNYFILFAFVFSIAIVIYNIQRLSPFMHYIELKNNTFVMPISEIVKGQYVEGETAGYGAKEIMEFARVKSKEKQVIVLAEGDYGLIGDVLNVFLKDDDKINIRGFWPLNEKTLFDNQKELKENLVYVVFSQRKDFPTNWPIKLIKKYDKPGLRTAYYLFELIR